MLISHTNQLSRGLLYSAIGLALLGSNSYAQEEARARSTAALEEIVVTATRREASLQEVPITITALTSSMLESAGVSGTADLADVTPGLVIARNSAIFQPTIRGIGSRAATQGDESNVAIYIDGVYQAEAFAGAIDFLELERVEVLRGPQGTLFGRNSTGGMINLITKKPEFEPSGNVELRYGKFNEHSARAYYTTGLSEKVAIDIAAMAKAHDGFVDDLVRGGETGGHENYAIRTNLLMDWTPDTQAIFTLSASQQDDNLPTSVQPIDGNTTGRPAGANPIPDDPWETATTFDTIVEVKQLSASLQTTTQLSNLTLETTTSWQKNKMYSLTDSDASTVDQAATEPHQKSEAATFEARLLSGDNSTFQWIAGFFGYFRDSSYDPMTIFRNSSPLAVIRTENETKSAAVFAEGTYPLTEQLSLTLGARYTWEERDFISHTLDLSDSLSFNEFTPRVSLQYFFSDTTNVYATYSRGFKSGVFNGGSITPVSVEPEIVDAYEIGLKSEPLPWLRTNFAAFYYDYEDIQLSQRDPAGVSILQNAATSTIKGLEAELTASVTDGLDLRFAATYLDATFDDFPGAASFEPITDANGVPVGGNITTTIDASGNDLIRAPDLTVNFGLSYERALMDGFLTASGNLYWSDDFYWEYENLIKEKAFYRVNGEIAWSPNSERFKVALWGKNLTNEEVRGNVVIGTTNYAWYREPRTYGASFQFNF